jgi:hypothetical protein
VRLDYSLSARPCLAPSSVYNITAQCWIINEIGTALAMAMSLTLAYAGRKPMVVICPMLCGQGRRSRYVALAPQIKGRPDADTIP